jgi:AraC family transcriptional regulator
VQELDDMAARVSVLGCTARTYDSRIQRAIDALNQKPGLRTAELARAIGISSPHLTRLFKQQVGVSIRQYAMQIRLHSARILLATTALPVKQVSHEVGIPDPSNFVRHFKKHFGVSPSAYRANPMRVLTNRKLESTN